MKLQETAAGSWLWVTRPEFYPEEDGRDREYLDPSLNDDFEGWWTCHRDTRRGDLVLLWRTSPKCDIGYLIRAETDAFSILGDPDAAGNWDYACEYRVLYKFANPVTKKDLDQIPEFQEWRPYRGRFQRLAFRIDEAYWKRLTELLVRKNPSFQKVLQELEGALPMVPARLEEDLERELSADLGRLKRHGYDLELVGRQVVCREARGRIDLLCRDRRKRQFVVLELKITRAASQTYGQIKSYMGWVRDTHAKGQPVLGLVISRGADNAFLSCLRDDEKVKQLDLQSVGFD